jgi:probable basic-leucine zipper transcription factor E
MMADSAFKVLVLPRGEQADISQFGAELQKICDKVSGVKVKLQADPNEITNSIKSAVSTVKFDVQFNASSIETSIKAALTGKTFDINVNPIVQNGGNNSNNNNNNNNHNNNNGGNRNPVWPKDSFSKIVNSQIYLENLKKKYNRGAISVPLSHKVVTYETDRQLENESSRGERRCRH